MSSIDSVEKVFFCAKHFQRLDNHSDRIASGYFCSIYATAACKPHAPSRSRQHWQYEASAKRFRADTDVAYMRFQISNSKYESHRPYYDNVTQQYYRIMSSQTKPRKRRSLLPSTDFTSLTRINNTPHDQPSDMHTRLKPTQTHAHARAAQAHSMYRSHVYINT